MVVAELVLVDFRNQRRNSPQSPVFFDQIIEQPLPSIPNMCIHVNAIRHVAYSVKAWTTKCDGAITEAAGCRHGVTCAPRAVW